MCCGQIFFDGDRLVRLYKLLDGHLPIEYWANKLHKLRCWGLGALDGIFWMQQLRRGQILRHDRCNLLSTVYRMLCGSIPS